MKPNVITAWLALCLFCSASTLTAQPVYQSRGANGPVFSDKPQPGAKAVDLRPLNTIDSATLTGGSAAEKGAAPSVPQKAGGEPAGNKDAALAYRSFAIVFPENDGSIVANTAVFEVRVTVDPALRLGEGHAIAVSINGQPVGRRFTATEFMIPPEFWGDQLPPANQRHQLAATIVDRNGAVLKEATPVQFQLRYATVLQQPYRPKPKPLPASVPVPQTKPAASTAIGGSPLPDSSVQSERQSGSAPR